MASGIATPNLDRSLKEIQRRVGKKGYLADLLAEQSWDVVTYRDDFLGDLLGDEWQGISNGTGATDPILLADQLNGVVDLNAGTADNGYSGLSLSLAVTAEHNPVFAVRFRIDDITNAKFEIGLTDAHADAGIVNVLATPTFTATDGVAVILDTDDTAIPQLAGVDSGTAATKIEPSAAEIHQNDGDAAPVNDEWMTVAIQLNSSGAARFAFAGQDGEVSYVSAWMDGAVTPTVQLTPFIFVQNRAAAATDLEVDLVELRWSRYAE